MPLDRDASRTPSAACLDPERAARFAAGALPVEEAVRAEQHLDACSACRRYVSALVKAGGPAGRADGAAANPAAAPGMSAGPAVSEAAPAASAPAAGPAAASAPAAGPAAASAPAAGPAAASAPAAGPAAAPAASAPPASPAAAPGTADSRERGRLIGTILKDTYRVLRVIGSGGMGVVYEAEHTRLPRRFAIKLLRESDALDRQARERFRREALVASELGHRHIAPVHDFDTTPDGLSYLVMDLLEGEDLAARLERGPLEVTTVVRLVSEIASALDLAHCRGIVHRDLKPANVFLCREPDGAEVVKVLDFGMSKLADSTSQLTRSLSYLGTPHYMAPEQARGDSGTVDPRSDVFALGVMTFEMLLGRRPFAGPSLEAILYQVVHEPLPSACAIDPRLPLALEPVLARATAKDRQVRHPSTGAFAADLAAALRTHAPPGARVEAGVRRAGLARRWLGPLLLASLAVGALAAALPLALGRCGRSVTAAGPAPAAVIEIRVDATPAHAVAAWDGRPLARGPVLTPADGRPHRVVVTAPGFQSLERTVVADRSQTLVLALAPAGPPASAAAPRSQPAPARPRARPPAGRAPAPAVPAPPIIEDPNEL
jgi:serine/threonine-protein kinase